MNCKKIVFTPEGSNTPCILLGVILEEGDYLIKFKTASKEYTISKSLIKEIRQTDETFLEEK